MHSSKIRPTLLPERGRRETATIPPTAQPHSDAGERAGKKQLSMQSDIQITNRNDTCFVDIEGVIGVPEEWQFDQPSSRVATYEKFRDRPRPAARNRRPGNRRQYPLDGRRRNDALLIYEALSSLDGHIVTRCYGYTASAATVIAQAASEGCRENIGPRPLPDPQFDLHRRRQCRRACDPHRPAPQNRRTPGGGLCRPFWPHSGGVHPPDGRKQRLRPLALSAGGTRRRTRRSDHHPPLRNACGTATPAGQWRKLLGKLGLVRPADALPPRPQHPPFRDPEKGSGPRTSELALHEASNSRLRPARSPAKIRRSEKRLPRPTSEPMPKMQSN